MKTKILSILILMTMISCVNKKSLVEQQEAAKIDALQTLKIKTPRM